VSVTVLYLNTIIES